MQRIELQPPYLLVFINVCTTQRMNDVRDTNKAPRCKVYLRTTAGRFVLPNCSVIRGGRAR